MATKGGILAEVAAEVKAGKSFEQIAKDRKIKVQSARWYFYEARRHGIAPRTKRSAA